MPRKSISRKRPYVSREEVDIGLDAELQRKRRNSLRRFKQSFASIIAKYRQVGLESEGVPGEVIDWDSGPSVPHPAYLSPAEYRVTVTSESAIAAEDVVKCRVIGDDLQVEPPPHIAQHSPSPNLQNGIGCITSRPLPKVYARDCEPSAVKPKASFGKRRIKMTKKRIQDAGLTKYDERTPKEDSGLQCCDHSEQLNGDGQAEYQNTCSLAELDNCSTTENTATKVVELASTEQCGVEVINEMSSKIDPRTSFDYDDLNNDIVLLIDDDSDDDEERFETPVPIHVDASSSGEYHSANSRSSSAEPCGLLQYDSKQVGLFSV